MLHLFPVVLSTLFVCLFAADNYTLFLILSSVLLCWGIFCLYSVEVTLLYCWTWITMTCDPRSHDCMMISWRCSCSLLLRGILWGICQWSETFVLCTVFNVQWNGGFWRVWKWLQIPFQTYKPKYSRNSYELSIMVQCT